MLDKKRANKIVAELREQRKTDDNEILEYLKSSDGLTSKDMLKIMDAMLENEPFFNFFIGKNFINYAQKNNQFFDLVVKLSRTERFGYDVSNLSKLYGIDPVIALFLLEKLQNIDEYRIALTSGYILGGLGQIKPEKLFDIIEENKNPTTNEKISYACALYILVQNQKIPKKFVDLLISYAKSSDKFLKHHAIGVLMMWFNNVKRIQKFLISFVRQGNENKSLVLQNITPIIKKNEKFCLRILQSCSNTDDQQLIHGVGLQIGYLAPNYPVEILTILKKWCKKQGFHLGQWPKWAAGEAGKGDIQKIEKFLLNWINVEKNKITFQFHLPGIIDEIYKGKDVELQKLLKKIDFKDKRKSRLIVKTLQESLSEGFRKTGRSESFLKFCNALLMKIVKHQKLEVTIDGTITNPVIKTLALVQAVEFGKKKIESSEIKKNLKYFPNMVSFFGKNRLNKLIEQKKSHPLVQILSRVPVADVHVNRVLKRIVKQDELWKKEMMLHAVKSRFYPVSILYDIDASFTMLGEKEQGITRLRDGMLDENDFYQTLIELNVYARFKKKYPTKLQPSVGKNKFDVDVNIENTRCLFEIYTPKEDIRLKYVRTVHSMENKARKGILAKLERQLKAADGLGTPVIFVIDKSNGASIDDIEITDSLFGTYQWTLMMDKEKGEIVKEYASRKKDSISEVSPYGKVISAVLLLKREMDNNDLKVKLYGQLFPNPGADIQLGEKIINEIRDVLLEKSIF